LEWLGVESRLENSCTTGRYGKLRVWEVKKPVERLGCAEPIGRIGRVGCLCFGVIRREVYEIGLKREILHTVVFAISWLLS
jgi:hypothetical protein